MNGYRSLRYLQQFTKAKLESRSYLVLLCHFVGEEVSRYDCCNAGQLLLAASFLTVLNDLKRSVRRVNVNKDI